jgi:hypothetical protein
MSLEMKSERRYMRPARLLITLGAILAVCSSSVAEAQEGAESVESKKEAVAKALCGEHGLVAKCVGLSPTMCVSGMMPLVDTCYSKRGDDVYARVSNSQQEAFLNCFWGEYLRRFNTRLETSDECIGSREGHGPLVPLPPHLEAQTKPLNN